MPAARRPDGKAIASGSGIHLDLPGIDHVLDRAAWFVFFGLLPPLWVSGVRLFARSGLTPRRKALWAVFLAVVGAAIGLLLPLAGIRDRFLVLLVLLPVLALVDIRLSGSRRTFRFWLRACSFEVCTVFGCAALTRFALTLR